MPPSLERSPESDEDTKPEIETKSKISGTEPAPKLTLTEADLMDGLQRGGRKDAIKRKEPAPARSRSISVEPDAEGRRRSRSRSVSLAAEDLKSIGGKRGGIAGNSKLFASEVDMRRQATGSIGSRKRVPDSAGLSFTGSAGNSEYLSCFCT